MNVSDVRAVVSDELDRRGLIDPDEKPISVEMFAAANHHLYGMVKMAVRDCLHEVVDSHGSQHSQTPLDGLLVGTDEPDVLGNALHGISERDKSVHVPTGTRMHLRVFCGILRFSLHIVTSLLCVVCTILALKASKRAWSDG